MFRYLYYRLRYGSYLKNAHGIKKFAERMMGQLIRRVTKKSAFYREQNENLLVEKANLRLRADELREQPMLDAGEFFSMRRRMLANTTLVVAFVVAAVFVNLISLAAIIEGDTALFGFLRWVAAAVLAVVLTGGGLIVTERLIESLVPSGRKTLTERLQSGGMAIAVLWLLLLVGLELAILGITDVRARALAQSGSTLFYYGFVILSMLLPIIAGTVRWDALRHLDVYKTTQALREIESRLAQIDSILRQNEEYESNYYKIRSISYWDAVNEFKTYKDNYNERNGISEALGGHFAQAYDAFQREASKRYTSDIRDVTAKSIRKLEQSERPPAGRKIGQPAERSTSALRPATAGSSNGNAAEEEYQELKPVR